MRSFATVIGLHCWDKTLSGKALAGPLEVYHDAFSNDIDVAD